MAKGNRQRYRIGAAAGILLACAAAALLCACGSGGEALQPYGTALPAASGALAELDALACPEGVAPELWQQLKSALRGALREQSRVVSAPPSGANNAVNDLAVTDDGGQPHFTWHYRNLGDYDQNGTVAIADLTPIAMHFGETYDLITQQNSPAAVIDGSGNGKVDIADVTAIAVGFSVNCTAYRVQNATTATADEWNNLDEVPQEDGTGDGRLEYAVTVDPGGGEYYRVVPVDADGAEGEPSNVQRFSTAPPEILSVSPTEVVYGTEVVFSATFTGSAPITFAWDFGEACLPSYSGDANPVVTVTETKGEYQCSVTATNAYGEDVFPFTLTVGGNPPEVQAVDYTPARVTQQITFTATVTGDEPMTYQWEFDGGVDPLTSTETSPVLDATEEGNFGGNVTVTNDVGQDQFYFNFVIQPAPEPPEILDIGPTGGNAGETIQVSANVRGSLPLTYTWDFNGAATSYNPSDASPEVTLTSTPGVYDECSLKLENEFGQVTQGFTMTVISEFTGAILVVDDGGPQDPPDRVGSYCRLVVADGHPAIAYHNSTKHSLKFIRATNPYGTEWNEPSITVVDEHDAGTWMDAAIIDGFPAVAYYNDTDDDLMFVRALDAKGSDPWGVPQTLDSMDNTGRHISLGIAGDPPGYPAVSYYKDSGSDLRFVRAENKEGFTWRAPITLDNDSCGVFNSLVMVEGHPAVSYRAYSAHELRFMRAEDSVGDTWPDTPIVAEDLHDPWYTCLAVLDGKPAIVYQNDDDGYLMFMRAEDAYGDTWGDPVVLDDGRDGEVDTGQYTSLETINGLPAVAYYAGFPDGALMYIVAQDAWGGAWEEPVMVDSGRDNNVGQYASLCQVSGHPAIAYYDLNDFVLKYVIANDPYGHDWPPEP